MQTTPTSPYPFHLPPWLVFLIAIVLGFAVTVVVAFSEPTQSPWLPPCLFHKWTGLHCPGCGNTRALHALAHGELLKSLDYNPLLIPYLVIIGILILRPRLSQNPKVVYGVLIVTLAFFILRNIPYFPFTLLAP